MCQLICFSFYSMFSGWFSYLKMHLCYVWHSICQCSFSLAPHLFYACFFLVPSPSPHFSFSYFWVPLFSTLPFIFDFLVYKFVWMYIRRGEGIRIAGCIHSQHFLEHRLLGPRASWTTNISEHHQATRRDCHLSLCNYTSGVIPYHARRLASRNWADVWWAAQQGKGHLIFNEYNVLWLIVTFFS